MTKPDQKEDDTYSEAETDARREAVLKNILSTPPKPRKSKIPRQRKDVQASDD